MQPELDQWISVHACTIRLNHLKIERNLEIKMTYRNLLQWTDTQSVA